jgi:sorbitol/mannitol transport system permease protein
LFFFISTRMMPAVAIILPLYIIVQNFGLLDNVTMLALIYTAMNLPIAVWMIRSFLIELPKEVLEAARVDGATLITEMRRIILPMIAPGLAATALICFIFAWNEFFFALLVLSDPAKHTLPLGIALFPGLFTMPWAEIAAASVLATAPLLVVVLVFQRRIEAGLTAGAVKG